MTSLLFFRSTIKIISSAGLINTWMEMFVFLNGNTPIGSFGLQLLEFSKNSPAEFWEFWVTDPCLHTTAFCLPGPGPCSRGSMAVSGLLIVVNVQGRKLLQHFQKDVVLLLFRIYRWYIPNELQHLGSTVTAFLFVHFVGLRQPCSL